MSGVMVCYIFSSCWTFSVSTVAQDCRVIVCVVVVVIYLLLSVD